jgi:MYXO-CTERM domain-containing protein
MSAKTSIVGFHFAFLLVAAMVAPASAALIPVTITNPGFVATLNQSFTDGVTYSAGNPLPDGYYVNSLNGLSTASVRRISDDAVMSATATVTGWTATLPHAGVASFSGLGNVANLVTVAEAGVGFTQTLPGNVQLRANATYTLSMVVRSLTIPLSSTFFADLTLNGTPLGGSLVYTPPINDGAPGSAVVTYIASSSPTAGNLGIKFTASDLSGITKKIIIDDVTVTMTPEPTAMGMLGLAGFSLGRRRR